MSASASKKKRKELEEQGISPKDIAAREAKEQKSKTTKNILIVALVVVVIAAAIVGVISLVNAPSYDVKAAVATVGEEKITVPIYDYFYNLSASNFYDNYSFLIQGGVPLSQQNSFFGEGTLEDYMISSTNDTLQEIYNVYTAAKKNGFELDDEQKESIDQALDSLKTEAATYGFGSADKYLKARFGEGCDTDSYEEYMKVFLTYTGYAGKLNEDFAPSAEELSAAYEADPSAFDIVSFTYATVQAEGTKAEGSEETTYSDEAKAAAKETAQGYTEEMPGSATTTSYNKSTVESYLNADIAGWLFDSARKEGDVMVFPRDENETYFYTVRFDSRDDNDYNLVNANIISISKDSSSTETAETETAEGEEAEPQQTAEEKRDALVAALSAGMSDEEFSAAVTELGYSASTNSITRTYSIEDIRDYLFDASRKAGDYSTFETDSAYYLVRFVSLNEESYRDTLVKNDLWNKYYESIAAASTIEVNEDMMQYTNTDLTFNASTSES